MTLYSGDEDYGDEITSPEGHCCDEWLCPHGACWRCGDCFRCMDDDGSDDVAAATGQERLNTAGQSTKGSVPRLLAPATHAPEGAAASRGMAEATKPGLSARQRLHACARCADHYGPGGEER